MKQPDSFIFRQIKKALCWYIDEILSDYKWYRKKQGGIWYLIRNGVNLSGLTGDSSYWSRELPKGDVYTVEKIEEFQIKGNKPLKSN